MRGLTANYVDEQGEALARLQISLGIHVVPGNDIAYPYAEALSDSAQRITTTYSVLNFAHLDGYGLYG